MIKSLKSRNGFALISILLMLVVIFILGYLALKPYLKKDRAGTSSPARIIDSVKKDLLKAAERTSTAKEVF